MTTKIKRKKIRWGIGHRILLAFMLFMFVGLAIIVFHLYTLSQYRSEFSNFKRVSDETNLMMKLDNNVVELQRQILVHNASERFSAISQIRFLYQQIIVDIASLVRLERGDAELQPLLLQMQKAVEQFGKNIKTLQESDEGRKTSTRALTFEYENSLEALNRYFVRASSYSPQAAIAVSQIKLSLSEAETFSTRYFLEHDFQFRKKTEAKFIEALERLSNSRSLLDETMSVDEIEGQVKLIEQVRDAYYRAVQADRDYLFLVNVVIAGEAAEFRTLADKLLNHYIDDQTLRFGHASDSLKFGQMVAIYASIFSVLLALSIAYVTGKGIAKPIRSIARTFEQLSAGENVKEIPGVDRADEIGRLASAANVFKKTNERTKSLLVRAECLTRDLKAREQELKKSNDELDSFAYVASHDLKSPLRAIYNLADWIEEDCEAILPDESKDHFNKLRGRIVRMENLLADLLRYSRVGRVDVQPEVKNAKDVVSSALELVDIPPGFRFHVSDDMPVIQTRVSPLVQTFQNLFTNAVKYTDKDAGEVEVSGRSLDEKYVEFTVTDNGPGIDPAFHQRIFQMFQTLQSRDEIEASGMGLAIIKKVVESEGGTIRVESKLGEGASFIFTWPKEAKVDKADEVT